MDVTPSILTKKGVEVLEYFNEENYSMRWFLDGRLHREDGPAVIILTGKYIWSKKGIRYRPENPFLTSIISFEEWYLNGKYDDSRGHRREVFISDEELENTQEVKLTEDNVMLMRWYLFGNHVSNDWLDEYVADIENITHDEKILMKLRWA